MAETYSFQNPYVYAANNPISFIDFMGLGPGDPPEPTVVGIFYEMFQNARSGLFNMQMRVIEYFGYGDENTSTRMRVNYNSDGTIPCGNPANVVSEAKKSALAEAGDVALDLLSLSPMAELSATRGMNGVFLAARTPSSIITPIARQFKNLECVPCADAMATALKQEGISGEIVTLQANSTNRGFIYSNTGIDGEHIISESGLHRGVLVDGKVYDNIHTEGINYQDWLNDFDVLGGFKEPIKTKF